MAPKKSRVLETTGEAVSAWVKFDPAALAPIENRIRDDALALSQFRVETQDDADTAAACLTEALGQLDALEKMRTSVTAPLNAAKRTVDSWFKPAKDALEPMIRALRSGIAAFENAKLEAARKAADDAANAASAGDGAGVAQALARIDQPRTEGIFKPRQRWTATVINEGLIPFTVPDATGAQVRTPWFIRDDSAILKHANDTPIDDEPEPIPGVKFTRETIIRGRHV